MLEVNDLTFTYPGEPESALDSVSLSVERGEVLGIVGPVGAGKTTLCMSLAGFVPSVTGGTLSGTVECNGTPIDECNDGADRAVAMVFEDFSAQVTQVHVLDEVVAPLRNQGLPREQARERAHELLERVGMGDLDVENKRTWELSGGQQQRVAIAAALAIDPDVLIFDNATGMLDPKGQRRVGDLIDELAGETTLIIVDDDADFVAERADRIAALIDGEIVDRGETDRILRRGTIHDHDGIEPPTPLWVAREAGLSQRPITADEFEATVDGTQRTDSERRALTPDGSGRPILQIEDATYAYGDGTRAIDSVSLSVHPGEVRALVGGNGAGKTTLTKLIAGLAEPDEGQVLVDGTDTRNETAKDLAWSVGTAFQNPDEQITEATVREEIAYPAERRRYEKTGWFSKEERFDDDDIAAMVERARSLVGIDEDVLERDPTLLPRGRRRLITIAEALVLDPEVVVLDEPMVGLDAASRHRVRDTIDRLRDNGKAVILVEHDMDLVCAAADTVTVLAEGSVETTETTRAVFARDNWDRLVEHDIYPPRAARLADRIGTNALTREELATTVDDAADPVEVTR